MLNTHQKSDKHGAPSHNLRALNCSSAQHEVAGNGSYCAVRPTENAKMLCYLVWDLFSEVVTLEK